jgi:hypothetical protein
MMNSKESERKQSWPISKYYPNICLEGQQEKKNFGQVSQPPDLELKPGHFEYKAGMLST